MPSVAVIKSRAPKQKHNRRGTFHFETTKWSMFGVFGWRAETNEAQFVINYKSYKSLTASMQGRSKAWIFWSILFDDEIAVYRLKKVFP